MPHGLIQDFKSQLPLFVAQQLSRIEAAIYTKINSEVEKLRQKLLNACPPPKELAQMTTTLTNLKKLLGSFDKKVSRFKEIPKKLDKPIVAGKVIVEILSHMPLPSTVGTPPGPAGGVIVSVPVGVIQAQANTLVFARKMVETLETDKKSLASIFSNLDGIFNPLISKVEQIEGLLQRCTENPNLSDDDRRKILEAAGALENDNTISDTKYIGSNGSTYTIKIINSEEDSLIAPKRRAVALDNRGVVVLKGPLSFAGNPDVLVDELKLRLERVLNPPIETENRLIITTAPKAATPVTSIPLPSEDTATRTTMKFTYDLSGLDLSFKTFLREKGYKDYVRTGLFQRKRAKTIQRASNKEKREYNIWTKQKEETEKEKQRAQQMLNNLNT
jgi:hypothetical protein